MTPTKRRLVTCLLALGLLVLVPAPTVHAASAKRLMIVGDSISQGSAGDFTWRYRLWKHLQATAPGAATFVGDRNDLFDNVSGQQGSYAYADPSFNTNHHALWGRPLVYEKDTIAQAVQSSGAQVLLVLMGINDLAWFLETPAQAEGYMETFVQNARSANPNLTFVIGHVMDRADLWHNTLLQQDTASQLDGLYDDMASRLSTAASPIITARTDAGWDPLKLTWDGTHPNSTGEVLIAAKFADALARLGIGSPYGSIPSYVQWPTSIPAPSATGIDRGIALSWLAAPGVTGYLIQQKIDSLNQTAFTSLPYPIAGTSWTARPLVPGWTFEFKVVPTKGVMQGVPSQASWATVRGAVPSCCPWLAATPGPDNTTTDLYWSSVPNASGYFIEYADLAVAPAHFIRLPYAVSGTFFQAGLLAGGHWYRWRVVPLDGTIAGPASNTVDVRTSGVPAYTAYYALGDSFSSGRGTGTETDACGHSPDAWPNAIPQNWEPKPTLLACDGARMTDVYSTQLPQVHNGPELITITVGGDDVDPGIAGQGPSFGNEVKRCFQTDCTGDENAISASIDSLRLPLTSLFLTIRAVAPGADVVVAGYPWLVRPPAESHCSDVFNGGFSPAGYDGISSAEKLMIRRQAAHLDQIIAAAAWDAGVIDATGDVVPLFEGPGNNGLHEACAGADGEYVNQVSVSNWNPFTFALGNTLHPNIWGQIAYAFGVNTTRTRLNTNGSVR
jgi:lysophospholipase L1-like esterase